MHSDEIWNSQSKEISILSDEVVTEIRRNKFRVELRCKELAVNCKDFDIQIQIIRHKSKPIIKVMPDFVSPHRPYPSFVYIFAVALYEFARAASQKISQKNTATMTRKCFGLGEREFSASSLCRARKAIRESGASIMDTLKSGLNDEALAQINQYELPGPIKELFKKGNAVIADTSKQSDSPKEGGASKSEQSDSEPDAIQPSLTEVFWEIPTLKRFVDKFLKGGAGVLPQDKINFAASVCKVCRKYFLINKRLLI